MNGALGDLARRNKRSLKDAEGLIESMRDPGSFESTSHIVYAIEVSTVHEAEGFHVLIDGVVFGPFSRIRICPKEVAQEGGGRSSDSRGSRESMMASISGRDSTRDLISPSSREIRSSTLFSTKEASSRMNFAVMSFFPIAP